MVVFDNEFETVVFHEDIGLFEAIWKERSKTMVDEDYRNEIVKQFSFIATKKFKFVLFDTQNFYFALKVETQKWNNEIIVSHFHEAGVKKVGIVLAPDIFSEVSVQQTMDETPNVDFETKSFETKEHAMEWFLS